MTDYSSGKIYKMYVEGVEDICYIGSTINSLVHRQTEHRYSAQSDAQYKFASAPFFQEDNNVLIELLEAYPCNTKQELLAKEAEWLLKFPEALNKNTPILDAEEAHRRANALCLKNYYKNRETYIEKNRAYKEDNKERIAAHQATPEVRARENQAHKKRMEDPEYAKAFKEKATARKTARVICTHCQKEFSKGSLSDHIKRFHTPL